MGMTIEARKKNGPFLPKWQKVKGSHKALSGKLFQPDITGAIERYDQTLSDYDTLIAEQDKLKGILGKMIESNEDAVTEIAASNAELTQLTTKMKSTLAPCYGTLRKYCEGGSGDLSTVKSALETLVSGADDYTGKRKQIFTDIDGAAIVNLTKFKKGRDDFVSQAAAAEAKMSKLQDEADKAESAIMSIVSDYVGIADDADHPEIVKSLKSLKV